jgi:hypothetical protein
MCDKKRRRGDPGGSGLMQPQYLSWASSPKGRLSKSRQDIKDFLERYYLT